MEARHITHNNDKLRGAHGSSAETSLNPRELFTKSRLLHEKFRKLPTPPIVTDYKIEQCQELPNLTQREQRYAI